MSQQLVESLSWSCYSFPLHHTCAGMNSRRVVGFLLASLSFQISSSWLFRLSLLWGERDLRVCAGEGLSGWTLLNPGIIYLIR